ncbi:MAG: hypothetical protein H7Z10_00445, partial [Gemmatimonadaceae bacterium]|nr:hypothetical protein [Acetobacteraceae bacterium]
MEHAPAPDPADAYARGAQTFPKLDGDMAARIAAYGAKEDVADGTVLFERGQRSVDFFLVLTGSIQIYEPGQ